MRVVAHVALRKRNRGLATQNDVLELAFRAIDALAGKLPIVPPAPQKESAVMLTKTHALTPAPPARSPGARDAPIITCTAVTTSAITNVRPAEQGTSAKKMCGVAARHLASPSFPQNNFSGPLDNLSR